MGFWKLSSSRGATMVEYLALVGVVGLAGIASFSSLREKVGTASGKQGDCVANMGCGGAAGGTAGITAPVGPSPLSDSEPACFLAGTKVKTRDGFVAIESLQVGDEVASAHERTSEPGVRKVTHTFRTENRIVAHLVLENEEARIVEDLIVTPEHPFYVPGQGFVAVGRFTPGETHVALADGSTLRVREAQTLARTETVYNLEVAEFHTYFVGATSAWVHNQYGHDPRHAGPPPAAPVTPGPMIDNSIGGPNLGRPRGAGPGYADPNAPPGAIIGYTPYGPNPGIMPAIPGSYLLSPTPFAPLPWMLRGGGTIFAQGEWIRRGGMPIYNRPYEPYRAPEMRAR